MNGLRFGEYTIDRTLRQLLRGQTAVPLPGKAFDLLAYMAENPGRPLTKSELLGAVWPDSFVEESNLSQNVFLLRKVLGSDQPIVTLPGRGYQFAAQVTEQAPLAELAVPAETALASAPAVVTMAATHDRLVYEEQTEERIAVWRSPLAMGVLAVGLVAVVAACWLGWQRYEDRVGGPPVQVVMADVDGGTGDAVLDRTLKDVLRIELLQSPFVTVVSGGVMRQTMVQMMRKAEDPVPLTVAREICERTGSQAVVQEHVARVGAGFLVTEEAINCADNSSMAAIEKQVDKPEEMPRAIDKMADSLRHSLGESRRTIARFNAPLQPATTSSLEALEDLSQATELSRHGKFAEGIELLKRAVALDPKFATAWLDMSTFSDNSLHPAEARAYLQKAYDAREYATEPTRLLIVARYSSLITGDQYESERNYKSWIAVYPRQVLPWSGLSNLYREMGRNADYLVAAKRTLELAPMQGVAYQGLADAQIRNGDTAGARATLSVAITKGFDGENMRYLLLRVGMLEHDAALVEQQVEWVKEHPDSPILLANLGQFAENSGKMKESEDLFDQMLAAFTRMGSPGSGVRLRQAMSKSYIELGEREVGKQWLHAAPVELELDNLLAMADLGEGAAAENLLKTQLSTQAANTIWRHFYTPVLEADQALNEGKPKEALAALERAKDYERRSADVVYLRGKAHLQAGMLKEAEGDFRFLLANPGIESTAYQQPMAKVWLARTLMKEGDKAGAAAIYGAFLNDWKDADANSALLAEVKKEAATVGVGA